MIERNGDMKNSCAWSLKNLINKFIKRLACIRINDNFLVLEIVFLLEQHIDHGCLKTFDRGDTLSEAPIHRHDGQGASYVFHIFGRFFDLCRRRCMKFVVNQSIKE